MQKLTTKKPKLKDNIKKKTERPCVCMQTPSNSSFFVFPAFLLLWPTQPPTLRGTGNE